MKYLIVSDSHGDIEGFVKVMEKEKPDGVLHLGDFTRDAEDLSFQGICPVKWVKGNCDTEDMSSLEEALIEIENFRVLMVHGHRYHVKWRLNLLQKTAQEKSVDIALFGHSHTAYHKTKQGICYFNPGTVQGQKGTYGVLEIKDGTYTLEHRNV